MKIIVAGAGAFGIKHLEGIKNIDGIEVIALVGRTLETTTNIAKKFNVLHAYTSLSDALKIKEVDAVILCTPTPLHATQAIECMAAGKHVQVEIPLADSWHDAQAIANKQKETGLICMVGHTRRFNPSHRWLKNKIDDKKLTLLQMNVQSYFFRRKNINAKGEPRSWTDHLLWHHAAHTVDLFQYQTGEKIISAHAIQGPVDPKLGISLDMSIQMQSEHGCILTLSLSFNNEGPLGSYFRYICDNGTYIARYDELVDGNENPIDLTDTAISMNGIELQDREFFAAIREKRQPNSSVASVIACYHQLHEMEKQLQERYHD